MRRPRERAKRVVVALSSRLGRGEARKCDTVWVGKNVRETMPGILTRASSNKALWMMDGMFGSVKNVLYDSQYFELASET